MTESVTPITDAREAKKKDPSMRELLEELVAKEGLALLNESAVACVSGELDPLFTGLVYCEVVCAFQSLAQYDQADVDSRQAF